MENQQITEKFKIEIEALSIAEISHNYGPHDPYEMVTLKLANSFGVEVTIKCPVQLLYSGNKIDKIINERLNLILETMSENTTG
ncbi:hypothetical protein BDE36_1762 [Arcticibacter tournemirensis]|uniref:Uncharacterized protein n=1 Tax=Arcticibacter tournemirensis TaxID=699437 RepID=A0A5M9HDT5_9SPHI|nr:hypothetical protein [Arcticibacter tournemirensis]KAA8483771.1 hypothetical protein F1649_07740 [Arcticibacter tournemirensis]TQM50027.1 hypothetical protein BDE36_1762 [Arcticibacter tournemirensis]